MDFMMDIAAVLTISGRKAATIIASAGHRPLLLKFASVMEHSIVTGRSASPKVILDNDLCKHKKGISILVY